MKYKRVERVSDRAQKVYDKAFCDFLEEGFSPAEAADKADEFLLAWSQPYDLPDPEEVVWR